MITVYDILLQYIGKWYQEHPTQAKKDRCILKEGQWVLSLKQKQDILLNNIYGVDIDYQAVEVTQLSLFLKLLEDETTATANDMQVLFKEKILPDLSKNIVCGNSLIGTDIYEGSMFPTEEEKKINAMNFENKFPDIMKNGGFDAIVGNPPYVRIQEMKVSLPYAVPYLKKEYYSASKGNYDIYVVFVERGLELLNAQGVLGFILPNKFFNSQYGEPIRKVISTGKHLDRIVHFGANQVFKGATTYTALMFLRKSRQMEFDFIKVQNITEWLAKSKYETGKISTDDVSKKDWDFNTGKSSNIIKKIKSNILLNDFANVFVGLQTSADDVFILDIISESKKHFTLFSKSLNKEVKVEKDLFHHLVSGTDVKRYYTPNKRQYILFPYEIKNEKASMIDWKKLVSKYPLTANYLQLNKKKLENREKGRMKNKKWYGYIYLKNMVKQTYIKICIPRLVDKLHCIIDLKGEYYLDNVDVCGITLKEVYMNHDLRYLCALINSKLLVWYFPFISATFRGSWYSANRQFISKLPIKTIDFTNQDEKAKHDKLVSLVEQILAAKKQLDEVKTEKDKMYYESRCNSLDREIDKIVYELYGLSEEDIRIVEEG